MKYFEHGLSAFDGAGICEGTVAKSAMNVANVNPTEGGLVDRITPTNWLHGSLHPTPSGHEMIAKRLLDEFPSLLDPNPDPIPDAAFNVRNVGGATPTLYDPTDLQSPSGIACPTDTPTLPFATRSLVFDEKRPIAVDAERTATVCYTGADGSWLSGVPGSSADVTVENEVVRVAAHPLGSRSAPADQRIVYLDGEGHWRLRLVGFCTRLPDCQSDQGEFINHQLGNAAKDLAIPILLIFAGGWLSTVGFSGLIRRVVGRAEGQRPPP